MKFAGKWKELENIIMSEVTQTQKDKHGRPPFWALKTLVVEVDTSLNTLTHTGQLPPEHQSSVVMVVAGAMPPFTTLTHQLLTVHVNDIIITNINDAIIIHDTIFSNISDIIILNDTTINNDAIIHNINDIITNLNNNIIIKDITSNIKDITSKIFNNLGLRPCGSILTSLPGILVGAGLYTGRNAVPDRKQPGHWWMVEPRFLLTVSGLSIEESSWREVCGRPGSSLCASWTQYHPLQAPRHLECLIPLCRRHMSIEGSLTRRMK
ncbi:hypothetical protein STEG23_026340, partial [Scotinomys teguina]